MRILLADDHDVVRKGLRTILEKDVPGCIVIEAADGLQAVDLARRLKPELAVLDISMPGLNGLEAVRQISRLDPGPRIIILSIHQSETFVNSALRYGASAYLLKECVVEELTKAIGVVRRGKLYLSPPLRGFLRPGPNGSRNPGAGGAIEGLSDREREILGLLAEGFTSIEIGKKLHLSPETVKTHRKNLMRKLRVHNLPALVKLALEHKLNPRL